MKYLNRIVLAWGYLTFIAIVAFSCWAYLSSRPWPQRTEVRPPLMDHTTLTNNPDFVAFTNALGRAGLAEELDPDEMAACFCFKTKAGRRRGEEWDIVRAMIYGRMERNLSLTDAQVRALLGEPDATERVQHELRYDVIEDGRERGFVTIIFMDGKTESTGIGQVIH